MKKGFILTGVTVFILFSLFFVSRLEAQDAAANAVTQPAGVTKPAADTAQPVSTTTNDKKGSLDAANMSDSYGKTPLNKLTRGVFNMSTFYFEVPAAVMRVSKEKDNYFIGSTIGTAQGFCACILRAVTAVFETATFLIPPYNKPIMQPEYSVQSLEKAQE